MFCSGAACAPDLQFQRRGPRLHRLYLDRHAPDEAESALQEAVSIREAALPPDHWRIAEARSVLGEARLALARFFAHQATDPERVAIYSTNTLTVPDMNTTTDFYGVIYTPYGDYKVFSNINIYGAIVARNVTFSGSAGQLMTPRVE